MLAVPKIENNQGQFPKIKEGTIRKIVIRVLKNHHVLDRDII